MASVVEQDRATINRRSVATVALTMSLLAASCSSGEQSAAPLGSDPRAVVVITEHAFSPELLEVNAGDTVAWAFADHTHHDVTFASDPASPILMSGTWSRTFHDPGDYDYVCSLHPDMTGTVSVRDAEPASADG